MNEMNKREDKNKSKKKKKKKKTKRKRIKTKYQSSVKIAKLSRLKMCQQLWQKQKRKKKKPNRFHKAQPKALLYTYIPAQQVGYLPNG